MTVVVGVDGAGRTHRLARLAAAADGPVVWVGPTTRDLADVLAAARADGALVLVDDAHHVGDDDLRALAAAARDGVPMAVARRPTVDRPALAELDEAVAARGPVEHLGPLNDAALADLVARATGAPADPGRVAALRSASAGLAALATALAADPDGPPPPALVARVQRRLTLAGPDAAALARVLALGLELPDEALTVAAGLSGVTETAAVTRTLRDAGLVTPTGERMIPAVAAAVLADLPLPERRRLHDAVARALLATGADVLLAAEQLQAARVRSPAAADVYRRAGDRLRFTAPQAALAWYDEALDAGADRAAVAVGRAEAAALLGVPADLDPTGLPPGDVARLAVVAGAVAAQEGRMARAAEALAGAGGLGGLLAVPTLVATGALEAARAAVADGSGPPAVRRLAEAALEVGDPVTALPLLIEAAEGYEQTPPALPLPDTPHALGAVVAVTAGDAASAEYLLDRAVTAGAGGPVAHDRHQALLAWARMRSGRYDTATAEVRRLANTDPPARERLLLAGLTAGLARRSGDVARLREAWSAADPVLARRAVDLYQLEVLEELLVAAARLRQHHRIEPVLGDLAAIVERLGRPPAWVVSLDWLRLQLAVVTEDVAAAAAAADALAAHADSPRLGRRQRAQCVAGPRWARALAGEVDADEVLDAAEGLVGAELPWEASRLVGHAAVRCADPARARRLLERARELAPAADAVDASRGGLSDREVEVARLVLAGRTHREIGAQLYLSPKTVEHHVARIRTKLGATTRAELIAALRRLFSDDPSAGDPLTGTA